MLLLILKCALFSRDMNNCGRITVLIEKDFIFVSEINLY